VERKRGEERRGVERKEWRGGEVVKAIGVEWREKEWKVVKMRRKRGEKWDGKGGEG
jgi:hypothetical protein